ncbi:MAG TPA: DoxX family protein [Candidatus Baltobacteraceae bacterium]|jgi:putative oxidoreductase|nr:DoxX family protein [Candidatus Baltobacteraceae bacterium]
MKHEDSVRSAALLVARVALGASIAAHGAQKLLGWFDGPGIEGATNMMSGLGFQPPERYARAASLAEITAGGLIGAGALGPVGPAILVSVMTVAVSTIHFRNGYFATNNGFELNTMYGIAALLLAVSGNGGLSVDELIGLRKKTSPLLGALAIVGGLGGAAFMLSRRTQQPPKPEMKQEWPRAATETGTIDAPTQSFTPNF